MNNKYKMMFFAPDAGGGEGGAGGEGAGELSKGAAALEPTVEPTPEADSAGTGGAETAPKPESFDPSRFAKEFGDVIGTHLAKVTPPATPKKELTPEEAKKLLNVWEPDDAWYARYDNLETRKTAISEMRDGLIRQGDTIAQLRMQEIVSALKAELAPQLTAVQEMAEMQRNERMGRAYPDLAKPELHPLVNAVAQDLVKQGKQFTTENELFKALASGVEAVIKVNNPEFKLTPGSSPGDNKGRSNNAIPVTTPGSGGSAGRRETGTQPAKPRGLSVFDKATA